MQSPREGEHNSGRSARLEQAVELGVFLFMIVPSMLLAYFAASPQRSSFPLQTVSVILRDLALVALVAFFIWRNGEPWSRLGWTARGTAKEKVRYDPTTLCSLSVLSALHRRNRP